MKATLKELINDLKTSFDDLPKIQPKDYDSNSKNNIENSAKEILTKTNIDLGSNFSVEKLDNLALTMLDKDITLFEDSSKQLSFLDNLNYETFDLSMLPDVMQGLTYYIKLIPNNDYPNSATVLTATFNASAILGQLRPRINDRIYSNDMLGLNVYGFAFLRSGSGKDRTQQAILDLFGSAVKTVDNYKFEEAKVIGKASYIRAMKQTDPNFDTTAVKEEDYKEYVPDIINTVHDTFMESTSTVEGLTALLNDAEKSSYSTANLFMSEMGMSIRSNKENVSKLFEKFAILYDMGKASKKVLKTKELREKAISDSYPNVFGISSPAFIFGDYTIKEFFQAYIMGAYGRRAIFIFPTKAEEYENRINVTSTIELNKINDINARKSNEVKMILSEELNNVVEFTHNNKEITFDEEAGKLYDYFRTYTKTLASIVKAIDPLNPIGVALEGKAFLTARIAGIWALLEKTTLIDTTIIKASIYFTLYTNNHLLRFMKKLNNKPYELIVDSYLQGEIKHKLPVVEAIKAGFITENRLTTSKIKEFLQPVNSLLKNIAGVSYSEAENAFEFKPFILVPTNSLETQYIYGLASKDADYQIVTHSKMHLLNNIIKAVKLKVFEGTTETNFIILCFKKSILSMQTAHMFFKQVVHAIGLGENKEDINSFTMIIPVATVIESAAEYRYVTKAISYELLYSLDSADMEYHLANNHGNTDYRIIHGADNLDLLNINDIKSNFISNEILERKDKFKKLTSKQLDVEEEELQRDRNILIEILNEEGENPNVWLNMFEHLVKYRLIYKDMDYIKEMADNINLMLNAPLTAENMQEHLLNPISKINDR